MQQTITRYFCDRCGAEFHPFGSQGERTPGYGSITYQRLSLNTPMSENTGQFSSRDGRGQLCPDCLDGLINYLNKKEI